MQVLLLSILVLGAEFAAAAVPLVANTWAFTNATDRAWHVLQHAPADGTAALEAVEQVWYRSCLCQRTNTCQPMSIDEAGLDEALAWK